MEDKILKFADNMPKLHGQTRATLVYWTALAGCQLKNHSALCDYDFEKSDSRRYKLNDYGRYFLLFFVGDKGIMFSTIRKLNDENRHYMKEVNQEFRIEVIKK